MTEASEYLKQRQRPAGRALMHQEWYDLLFVHYSVDPAIVQALLPAGLTVDTYPDAKGVEKAWIGIVPFAMRGVRPVGVPALPWISKFLETNVRTYVHREGKDPGVWFFSLDAARWLACKVARATYCLPYYHATMAFETKGNHHTYRMGRNGHGPGLVAKYEIGDPIDVPPGSFEFWLVERYRLYASTPSGLRTGLVHHEPYPVCSAKLLQLETTLPTAVGLPTLPPEHVCYSPGVEVEVFGLRAIP